MDDGFRKTVTQALCWYDHLGWLVDERVEKAVEAAGKHLNPTDIASDSVKSYLKKKCPACFGGKFGIPVSE